VVSCVFSKTPGGRTQTARTVIGNCGEFTAASPIRRASRILTLGENLSAPRRSAGIPGLRFHLMGHRPGRCKSATPSSSAEEEEGTPIQYQQSKTLPDGLGIAHLLCLMHRTEVNLGIFFRVFALRHLNLGPPVGDVKKIKYTGCTNSLTFVYTKYRRAFLVSDAPSMSKL